MTFDEWIRAEDITFAEAARRIGVANASVARRYARAGRVPRPRVLARIVQATAGLVTANDFFGLPGPETMPLPARAAE